jgi:hypothetical protein
MFFLDAMKHRSLACRVIWAVLRSHPFACFIGLQCSLHRLLFLGISLVLVVAIAFQFALREAGERLFVRY